GGQETSGKGLFQGFLPNLNGDGAVTNIPSGQAAATDLSMALDALFNHPNVAPYLARELIHNLVTSNPSPAYVERVAGFFNDNGSGVPGSIWAMGKGGVLDPLVRTAPLGTTDGQVKEPTQLIPNNTRGFGA